ncbi:carboxypeptidase-like regulatory domain-containing protein [Fibrella forsythiae]|uniref:Carboxypeptidase-like regulatory domain-containing protein n=1 Tax=Fibrella forsythiae TaxID=2817061 RepID=A0ABS3JJV6_9BACT|nr:carboxypeptidase-like regulatory domain-containing protein [Fibrella forsythiae]MBO0950280.1 carboxypeptidase-like regulatory domain-containing protein [Fibrella forsythiae]
MMRLLLLLLLISLTAQAQFTLRGRVVNAADGQPVPFCSVFLANTTKGTTADENGSFVLANLPAGRFDLVVSSVGFETLASPINTNQPASLLIRIMPSANQLAEVQVRANRDPEWLEQLGVFLKNFIGTSKNAQECKIINQNALWFDDNRATMRMTGGAREPLIIDNKALGYRIRYVLEQFLFDYGNKSVSYLGYPVYELMKPRGRREALRWEKARTEAYRGSSMHFMRTLYAKKTAEEGFEIRRVLERTDSSKVAGQWRIKKARYLVKDALPATFLLSEEASTDSTTALSFENLIQVTYTLEKESPEYVRSLSPFSEKLSPGGPQTSLIYLTEPTVTIERNGNFYNPLGVIFEGYWGWEKMAELLPLTYEP